MEFFGELSGFRRSPIRDEMIGALDHAFNQNSPETRVLNFLSKRGDLDTGGKLYVIGFGKAGRGMYAGVKSFFGDRISTARIIVPIQYGKELSLPFLPGNHPLPSTESIESSKQILESLKNLNREDLVIVLISGGGSSLFEVLKKGVDQKSFNETVNCLMKNGATISELNSIRYLFSDVKGGGLLNYTYPARVLSLIISDVPGDSEGTVASGPTFHPPDQALIKKTMEKFRDRCPLPSIDNSGARPASRADNNIILRNSDFVSSILDGITRRGHRAYGIGSGIEGDTSAVARFVVEKMREKYRVEKNPVFVVGGGETSTRAREKAIGGRNLELTLQVLLLMNVKEEFVFCSIGTDGMDGSSKAMGAIVDSQSLRVLKREYITDRLLKSESLAPLESSGDVLFTGFTGTNVADIFIGYYAGADRDGN